jgi:uncharacterized protein HemY
MMRAKQILLWILLLAFGVVGILAYVRRNNDAGQAVALPEGVARHDYDSAAVSLERRGIRAPNRADVLHTIALNRLQAQDYSTVNACLAEIPSEHPLYGQTARLYQGQALVGLKRAAAAEQSLREYIDLAEQSGDADAEKLRTALDLLRYLLGFQLRFEERHNILRVMFALGSTETFETMAYAFPNLLRWNGPQAVSWLEEFWQKTPDDFNLRVALGRYRTGQGRLDEAEQVLKQCCDERPGNLRAHAALSACYQESGDWAAMQAVLERLPPSSDDDPWMLSRLRGHLCNQQGRYEEAIECFQGALKTDRANSEAYLGLAKAYGELGREEERRGALAKTRILARIQNRLGWVLYHPRDVEPLLEIASLAREIGLHKRANAIAKLVLKIDPDHQDAQDFIAELSPDGTTE